MKTNDLSKIKKFMAGPEGRRLAQLKGAQLDLPQRFQNPVSRRSVTKLFISALRQFNRGGIDYRALEKRFADISANDAAQLAVAARNVRAAAVKGSIAARKILEADTKSRLQALSDLEALPPTVASPKYNLLKAPFEIVPTSNLPLETVEAKPGKSFVKFHIRLDRKSLRGGAVQFNYLWQNLSDKFAVINVAGYMIFHGFGHVASGAGICAGDRSAAYTVAAEMSLLQFWNQPPTQPFQQPDQLATVSSLSERTDGISEVGALASTDIFRGYDLRHTLLTVPPEGVVVIRLSAKVGCSCGSDSGIVELDFASGAFNIGSPAVLVTILT